MISLLICLIAGGCLYCTLNDIARIKGGNLHISRQGLNFTNLIIITVCCWVLYGTLTGKPEQILDAVRSESASHTEKR